MASTQRDAPQQRSKQWRASASGSASRRARPARLGELASLERVTLIAPNPEPAHSAIRKNAQAEVRERRARLQFGGAVEMARIGAQLRLGQ